MTASQPMHPDRAGFSLVELIVAILILSIGVLAMAGSTAFVIRTVTVADLNTQRSAALQATVESLRSLPFDDIASGATEEGSYQITWVAVPSGAQPSVHSKAIEVVTTGPGMQPSPGGGMPAVSNAAVDTFRYVITRR